MISFEATIQKFGNMGEKTGWIYIAVPVDIAVQIKPNYKKSYRVKGFIDKVTVQSLAMLPMGVGNYIIATNANLRKAINKSVGAKVKLQLQEDDDLIKLSPILLECIAEVEEAKIYFDSLLPSHKQYYSNWVKAAKQEQVIAARIAIIIKACSQKLTYSEMMWQYKKERDLLN